LVLTNWLQTSVQTYKWTSQVKEKILKSQLAEYDIVEMFAQNFIEVDLKVALYLKLKI
jgi:hypothetical protein